MNAACSLYTFCRTLQVHDPDTSLLMIQYVYAQRPRADLRPPRRLFLRLEIKVRALIRVPPAKVARLGHARIGVGVRVRYTRARVDARPVRALYSGQPLHLLVLAAPRQLAVQVERDPREDEQHGHFDERADRRGEGLPRVDAVQRDADGDGELLEGAESSLARVSRGGASK